MKGKFIIFLANLSIIETYERIMESRVCTWGTFDGLHKGHTEFLTHASEFGKLLVIVVPSEVKLQNNGYLPLRNEYQRKQDLLLLGKGRIIDDVVIDCYEWGLKSVLKFRPDIFVFGYDQSRYWKNKVLSFLRGHSINVREETLPKYNNGLHAHHYNGYHTVHQAL